MTWNKVPVHGLVISLTVEQFSTRKSKYDHSVFFWNFDAGIILMVVYVDDILLEVV